MRATRSRVAWGIFWLPRSASDTVDGDTPAFSAIARRLMRSTSTQPRVVTAVRASYESAATMNACFHLRPALQGAANVEVADPQARIFSRVRVFRAALHLIVLGSALLTSPAMRAADLRIGVIGIDSSHSGKFAEAFNGPD